jgi:hypothetical protein
MAANTISFYSSYEENNSKIIGGHGGHNKIKIAGHTVF